MTVLIILHGPMLKCGIIAFHLSSPPPLCGAISADDKYKCKPADQVRESSVTGTCMT